MKKIFGILCILFALQTQAQYGSFDFAKSVKPFKIFDNLYYVGNDAVSAYILMTDKGIVLIDALYAKFTEDIPVAFRQLGFDIKDVKYIICTHGHFDHCEGAEAIQKLSHARIGMLEADWQIAEGSVKADWVSVSIKMKRDWVIKNGDSLVLGNTSIHFYETPGHTAGTLSMDFPVIDGKNKYKAFMFGGVGLNFEGVERTTSYINSVNRIMEMKGIAVNISNHPAPGKIFEKAAKLSGRKDGDPHPFIAPDEFQLWLTELKKNALVKLEEEKKKQVANLKNLIGL
jgi:metallo-beta-lactamase class B